MNLFIYFAYLIIVNIFKHNVLYFQKSTKSCLHSLCLHENSVINWKCNGSTVRRKLVKLFMHPFQSDNEKNAVSEQLLDQFLCSLQHKAVKNVWMNKTLYPVLCYSHINATFFNEVFISKFTNFLSLTI